MSALPHVAESSLRKPQLALPRWFMCKELHWHLEAETDAAVAGLNSRSLPPGHLSNAHDDRPSDSAKRTNKPHLLQVIKLTALLTHVIHSRDLAHRLSGNPPPADCVEQYLDTFSAGLPCTTRGGQKSNAKMMLQKGAESSPSAEIDVAEVARRAIRGYTASNVAVETAKIPLPLDNKTQNPPNCSLVWYFAVKYHCTVRNNELLQVLCSTNVQNSRLHPYARLQSLPPKTYTQSILSPRTSPRLGAIVSTASLNNLQYAFEYESPAHARSVCTPETDRSLFQLMHAMMSLNGVVFSSGGSGNGSIGTGRDSHIGSVTSAFWSSAASALSDSSLQARARKLLAEASSMLGRGSGSRDRQSVHQRLNSHRLHVNCCGTRNVRACWIYRAGKLLPFNAAERQRPKWRQVYGVPRTSREQVCLWALLSCSRRARRCQTQQAFKHQLTTPLPLITLRH